MEQPRRTRIRIRIRTSTSGKSADFVAPYRRYVRGFPLDPNFNRESGRECRASKRILRYRQYTPVSIGGIPSCQANAIFTVRF